MSEASSTPPPPPGNWYVSVKGEKRGPLDYEEIRELAQDGEITATTMVWRKGMKEWEPAGKCPELAELFGESSIGANAARVGAALSDIGQALGKKAVGMAKTAASSQAAGSLKSSSASIWSTLFDFQFNHWIYPQIVRMLYKIMLFVNAGIFIIALLLFVFMGFKQGFLAGIGSVIAAILLGPLFFLLVAILNRLYAEMLMLGFKILENLMEINRKTPGRKEDEN